MHPATCQQHAGFQTGAGSPLVAGWCFEVQSVETPVVPYLTKQFHFCKFHGDGGFVFALLIKILSTVLEGLMPCILWAAPHPDLPQAWRGSWRSWRPAGAWLSVSSTTRSCALLHPGRALSAPCHPLSYTRRLPKELTAAFPCSQLCCITSLHGTQGRTEISGLTAHSSLPLDLTALHYSAVSFPPLCSHKGALISRPLLPVQII